MRNIGTVFHFELKNQLLKKSVIIATVAMMLLMFSLTFVPRLMFILQRGDASQNVRPQFENVGFVLSDGEEIAALKVKLNLSDSQIEKDVDTLKAKVADGVYKVGYHLRAPLAFTAYWQDRSAADHEDEMMRATLSRLYQETALQKHNLSLEEVEQLQNAAIEKDTVIMGKDGTGNALLAFAFILLIYIMVLLYGNVTSVMVAREKDSKAMELLITSAKPYQLILGKVLASAVSAVVQLSAILLAAAAGYMINKAFIPDIVQMVLAGTMTRGYLFSLIYYVLLGYIMYLFLFAAMGSTVSKVEDVQSATSFIQLVFVAGYLIASFSLQRPNSMVVKIASYIPFTSMLLMPLRTATASVPLIEYLISGAILLVTTVLTAILSIKIYRWGTLHYGNKVTLFSAIKSLKKQA